LTEIWLADWMSLLRLPSLRFPKAFKRRAAAQYDVRVAQELDIAAEQKVLENPEWERLLSIIQKWFRHCEVYHKNCGNLHRDKNVVPIELPTRLLYVGSDAEDDRPRLVSETELRTATTPPKFAALSYCWGKINDEYKTTAQNVDERRSGIAIGCLPRTIRDAIYLCRKLGINYLWVDALCITQRQTEPNIDEGDWGTESLRMNMYYRRAHFTIAGLEADASTVGFLKHKTPRNTWDDILRGAKVYPLFQRGWAMQEHLLSARIIYFTDGSIHWQCDEGCLSEMVEGTPYDFAYISSHAFHKQRLYFSSKHHNPQQDPLDLLWYQLIERYSHMSLSFPSDVLPAISGLAKEYHKFALCSYFAGIWERSVILGLTWEPISRSGPPLRRNPPREPSWSWTASTGSVQFVPCHGWKSQVEVMQLVHADILRAGDDQYSAITRGTLFLDSFVARLQLEQLSANTALFGGVHVRLTNRYIFDDPDIPLVDGQLVDAAVICVRTYDHDLDISQASNWLLLLFQQTAERRHGYALPCRRVGIALAERWWFPESPRHPAEYVFRDQRDDRPAQLEGELLALS
jgi:Heterokaryon incompatibility protein (HET)